MYVKDPDTGGGLYANPAAFDNTDITLAPWVNAHDGGQTGLIYGANGRFYLPLPNGVEFGFTAYHYGNDDTPRAFVVTTSDSIGFDAQQANVRDGQPADPDACTNMAEVLGNSESGIAAFRNAAGRNTRFRSAYNTNNGRVSLQNGHHYITVWVHHAIAGTPPIKTQAEYVAASPIQYGPAVLVTVVRLITLDEEDLLRDIAGEVAKQS